MTGPGPNTCGFECQLHRDRTRLGSMRVSRYRGTTYEAIGPYDCLGIADRGEAAAHHNPTSDSLLPFGNTPTGDYLLVPIPAHSATLAMTQAYGPTRLFLMCPVGGDGAKAAVAPGHRAGLLIHGGDLNPAYTQWHGLRPTYGCIRMRNQDLLLIWEFIGATVPQLRLTVDEVDGPPVQDHAPVPAPAIVT